MISDAAREKTETPATKEAWALRQASLLKWDRQPERRGRTWTLTVCEQRRRVQRVLKGNPGLKSQLDATLAAAYEDARLEAANETDLPTRSFPEIRPFDVSDIMERAVVWPGDEA